MTLATTSRRTVMRLAMIDAKLKGECTDTSEPEASELTWSIAARKKSLGQAPQQKKPAPTLKKAAAAAKVAPIKPPRAGAKRKRA